MDIQAILKTVDHTLLRPEATWPQIKACATKECVMAWRRYASRRPMWANAAQYLNGNLPVCTVVGFPMATAQPI